MKKREITNEFEEESLVHSLARWLNLNKDCLNINGIAKKAGIGRFALIALMAGKSKINYDTVIKLDRLIAEHCDRHRKVEVKRSLPDGMIEANDDEFI